MVAVDPSKMYEQMKIRYIRYAKLNLIRAFFASSQNFKEGSCKMSIILGRWIVCKIC